MINLDVYLKSSLMQTVVKVYRCEIAPRSVGLDNEMEEGFDISHLYNFHYNDTFVFITPWNTAPCKHNLYLLYLTLLFLVSANMENTVLE